MSFDGFIKLLGYSFFPYALSRLFVNLYTKELLKKMHKSDDFSEKRLRIFNYLRHIFAFLGLIPTLILNPISNSILRELYSRYISDLRKTYLISTDRRINFTDVKDALESQGIPINDSASPLDLPETWYQI